MIQHGCGSNFCTKLKLHSAAHRPAIKEVPVEILQALVDGKRGHLHRHCEPPLFRPDWGHPQSHETQTRADKRAGSRRSWGSMKNRNSCYVSCEFAASRRDADTRGAVLWW
jgi:hypothetical protein